MKKTFIDLFKLNVNLKKSLSELNLVKVKDETISKLEKNEEEIIYKFILNLIDEDKCQIIFRGDKLFSAFSTVESEVKAPQPDLKKIVSVANSKFFIGEKASSYFFENSEDKSIYIRDTSTFAFEKIYDYFIEFFESNSKKVPSYKNIENYFKNNSKEHFINKICNFDENSKIQIRFYYLWLLHTLGKSSSAKKYSFFLSTSKNINVAKHFSNDEIIYCGWIPRPIKDRAVYMGGLKLTQELLKSNSLPTFFDEPYSEQDEISLIGVLFPQYLFGIYWKDKFIVNSYLLSESALNSIDSGHSEAIIQFGVKIDQTIFEESDLFKKSIYKRYVEYKDGNFYE